MRTQRQDMPTQSISQSFPEAPPPSPIIIKVLQEDRGWYVEHDGRIGPFFSKKTATDVAADWVAAIRASGEAAGMEIVDHFDLPKH